MLGRQTVLKGCDLQVQSRYEDIEFAIDTFFEVFTILLKVFDHKFSRCFFVGKFTL